MSMFPRAKCSHDEVSLAGVFQTIRGQCPQASYYRLLLVAAQNISRTLRGQQSEVETNMTIMPESAVSDAAA